MKPKLTNLEEFILCEVAPNFVFGCTWAILSQAKKEEWSSSLCKLKEDHGLKIKIFSKGQQLLVDFDPKLIIASLQSIGKNKQFSDMRVEEDIKLYNKNRNETINQFIAHVKKTTKEGTKAESLGLFCVNETPRVRFKVGENTVSCNAYRLSFQDVKIILTKLNIPNHIEIRNIAPSDTAVLADITYK